MSDLRTWLSDINVLVLPVVAAVGAFGREMFDWLRGRRAAESELTRTDMEVGRALRDELRAEIQRQDARIEEQEAECRRRMDEMEQRLRAVQHEADEARAEAGRLRAALKTAEKTIASLRRQFEALKAA